jgi:hypothetical protein
MNGIMSPVRGVALADVDGRVVAVGVGRWFSTRSERSRADVRHLMVGAPDVEPIVGRDLADIRRCLERAHSTEIALQTTLLMLDSDLPQKTRTLAAETLQVTFGDSSSGGVRDVLFSAPLPPEADLRGARIAAAGLTEVRQLIEDVDRYQNAIRRVHDTWEGVGAPRLEQPAARARVRRWLVRAGAFRQLVEMLGDGRYSDDLVRSISKRPAPDYVDRCEHAVSAWTAALAVPIVPLMDREPWSISMPLSRELASADEQVAFYRKPVVFVGGGEATWVRRLTEALGGLAEIEAGQWRLSSDGQESVRSLLRTAAASDFALLCVDRGPSGGTSVEEDAALHFMLGWLSGQSRKGKLYVVFEGDEAPNFELLSPKALQIFRASALDDLVTALKEQIRRRGTGKRGGRR